MKYLVVRSFGSLKHGSHAEGDVIELDEAQASELGALVQPIARQEEAAPIETADLPVEHVEKAVKRTKKKEG